MSKIDEILPVRTMSWTRAIGSYIFATLCGGAIGVAVREPDLNVVWKICFSVALFLAAAVMYLWVVMIPPPGAAPAQERTRAMELFSLACSQNNVDVAAGILETGEIPNSLLQDEASRAYGVVGPAPENFQMFAWLVGRLCKKAPALLWQTRNPSWSGAVDRWAMSSPTTAQ